MTLVRGEFANHRLGFLPIVVALIKSSSCDRCLITVLLSKSQQSLCSQTIAQFLTLLVGLHYGTVCWWGITWGVVLVLKELYHHTRCRIMAYGQHSLSSSFRVEHDKAAIHRQFCLTMCHKWYSTELFIWSFRQWSWTVVMGIRLCVWYNLLLDNARSSQRAFDRLAIEVSRYTIRGFHLQGTRCLFRTIRSLCLYSALVVID